MCNTSDNDICFDDLSDFGYAESKKESLPNEIIIDDVIYEYGDDIYRIKGFVPNETGEYHIYCSHYCFPENTKLLYYEPFGQLPKEQTDLVKHLHFIEPPSLFEKMQFSNLETAEIDDLEYPNLFYKGCLFLTNQDRNKLTICYVPDKNIEEIELPEGFEHISQLDKWHCIELLKLRKIKIHNDVRLIDTILLKNDDVVIEIDNTEHNCIFLNPEGIEVIVSYTNNPCPVVDFSLDGIDYSIIGEDEVSISGASEFQNIVSKVCFNGKSYRVTAISDYAFRESDIKDRIDISFVNKIGFGAFYGCSRITDVVIGGALNIGDYAFYGCTNLKTVFSNDPYGIVNIGNHAFEDCASLKDFFVPNPIGTIKSRAFLDCKNLINIFLPSEIQVIEDYAFGHNQMESVTFSGIIPSMTSGSFGTVENVYFSNNAVIGKLLKAFGQESLRFGFVIKPEYIVIPEQVTSIDKNSFKCIPDCHNIRSFNDNVKYLYLPESIQSIEDEFFLGMRNLKRVFCFSSKYRGYGTALFEINELNNTQKLLWHCPIFRETGDLMISEKTTVIAKSAFSKLSRINKVLLHENDLFVDKDAFAYSSIKEITLYPKTKLYDKHVFKASVCLNKITDQTGKVYDDNLVKSYSERLQAKKEEAGNKLINVPLGCTDKEAVLKNYFYALVEMACTNMLYGDRIESSDLRIDKDSKCMNVADLFAYEMDIDELLSVNLSNPSNEEMNDFVSKCKKWMISLEKFRDTEWADTAIIRRYNSCQKADTICTTFEGIIVEL